MSNENGTKIIYRVLNIAQQLGEPRRQFFQLLVMRGGKLVESLQAERRQSELNLTAIFLSRAEILAAQLKRYEEDTREPSWLELRLQGWSKHQRSPSDKELVSTKKSY